MKHPKTLSSLLVAGLLLAVGSPAALAASDPLEQTLAPDAPTEAGRVVVDRGHVDVGPRLQDGEWSLQLHVGSGPESSWRLPEDVVLDVTEAASLTVPDDPAYAFLRQPAGTAVSVVPQTQAEDVVWVGWNTQDPAVMSSVDRGVTLTMRDVQGPGDLVVYLQSGNLGAPEVLWDSTVDDEQGIFVDTNTHTHANWVFTEPGTYLVDVEASATLLDGSEVSASAPLRFAVGEGADAEAAFAATYEAPAAAPDEAADDAPAAVGDEGGEGLLPVLLGVGAGVAALVVALLVVLLVRSSRARRAALAERDALRAQEAPRA